MKVKVHGINLFFIIIGLILLFIAIHGYILIKSTRNWEKTEGVLLGNEIEYNEGYFLNLGYSYMVGGKLYYSKKINPTLIISCHSKEFLEKELKAFEKNLIVYYNPDNPSISCLKPNSGYSEIYCVGGIAIAMILVSLIQIFLKDDFNYDTKNRF